LYSPVLLTEIPAFFNAAAVSGVANNENTPQLISLRCFTNHGKKKWSINSSRGVYGYWHLGSFGFSAIRL